MKVLIVSFDKTLTEGLQKALEDQGHEVYTAKNSEEAIKMIPSDVEGVIYDAISGAISEEDINALYTKKFSNARYLILYDELFPVDENNIVPPQKLLVPRDTEPKEVVQKLVEFKPEQVEVTQPQEEAPPEAPEEFEIEPTALTESPVEEVVEVQEEQPPVQEEVPQQEEVVEEPVSPAGEIQEGGKLLIVSFDQALIDSLKAAFGQQYDVVSVKTVKQAMEHAREARLIVFDAISGVIAEKGLIEMAGDNEIASKPFVILVDDLFPINVDNIPLENKVAVSRDTDPERLKEIVREELEKAPAPQVSTQEQPTEQPVAVEEQEPEEQKVEEIVEEIPQVPEEIEVEPVEEPAVQEESVEDIVQEIPQVEDVQVEEVAPKEEEEEEIPALEALEKIIEERKLAEESAEETEEVGEEMEPATVAPQVDISQIDVERVIEDAISRALSEDRIKEAVLKAIGESMGDIRNMISEVVKQEVDKAFEELDIKNLVRQATYQALKEKLEQLIS